MSAVPRIKDSVGGVGDSEEILGVRARSLDSLEKARVFGMTQGLSAEFPRVRSW
jgi:hypothetical protein